MKNYATRFLKKEFQNADALTLKKEDWETVNVEVLLTYSEINDLRNQEQTAYRIKQMMRGY